MQNSQEQNNTNKFHSNLDMASAVKFMPKFSGKDEEDVTIWIRDCGLVVRMAGLSEEMTLRVMILSLEGTARFWAAQASVCENLTFKTFTEKIRRRFSNQNRSNQTLSRFLTTKQVTSYYEFRALLKDATLSYEKNLLQTNLLSQMLIAKAPTEIKAFLFEKGNKTDDWHTFVTAAEKTAWIAFPETLDINQIK